MGTTPLHKSPETKSIEKQQVADVSNGVHTRPALLQLISSACLVVAAVPNIVPNTVPNNDTITDIYLLPHEGSITNRQLRQPPLCNPNLQSSIAQLAASQCNP